MDHYCGICDKTIKIEYKNKQNNSKLDKEFEKCDNIVLSLTKVDINDVDNIFYSYIIEHNKKFEHYFMKCDFKLVSNDNQFCPSVASELYSIETMCSWYKFLENVISDFKDKGFNFSQIAETNVITFANKLDMSYDFYITHNISSVNWKLNAVINKNENLINKFNRNWRHPLNRKFESYRV